MEVDDAGFEAALAQIDAWSAEGERQVALAQSLQQSLGSLSATAWSPGREVRVTVDHGGQLSDIVFEDRAMATAPAALGRIVTTTIQRALAALQVQVIEVARATAGEGSPMALSVENEYRTSFERSLAALGEQRDIPRA